MNDYITIALQVSVFSLICTNYLRNGLCDGRLLGDNQLKSHGSSLSEKAPGFLPEPL